METKTKVKLLGSTTIILILALTLVASQYYNAQAYYFNRNAEFTEWANDDFKITGEIEFYKNDMLQLNAPIPNTITNIWKNTVRDYISNTSASGITSTFDYIAIGTGSGGGAGSTTLASETNRTQGTYTEPANYQFRVTSEFNNWNFTFAITEAGCLNASSSGILFNYQDFGAVNVASGDNLTVQITWTIS